MALLECYECGNQVSDSADACPKCGAPSRAVAESTGVPVKTIQATSKKLKAQLVMAFVVTAIGATMLFSGMTSRPGADPVDHALAGAWQFAVTGLGMLWMIVTKFRMWWHHG